MLSQELDAALPALIYAGQAGATKWPSGTRSPARLDSRIIGNHLKGNIKASTFRKALAAVLREPLGLHVVRPDELATSANECLTMWIQSHLRVVIQPYNDRHMLKAVERVVLAELDPPLNLEGMKPSAVRRRLEALRGKLREVN